MHIVYISSLGVLLATSDGYGDTFWVIKQVMVI